MLDTRILIAILAGGGSRRMGTDKARISSGGRSWLAHISEAAARTGCRVAVVGRSRMHSGEVSGPAFLEDVISNVGPMGGLLTALRYSGTPVVAVGCDMPLLTSKALTWLIETSSRAAGPLGLTVQTQDGPEPLFSYYRQTCLTLVERRIGERRLSLRDMLTVPGFCAVEAPDWVQDALRNVNTPAERIRLGL